MAAEILDRLIWEDTLLVQKTLRSGQSIRHTGSVVVLGDVNPGAEIIAGGHVIVAGVLRGKVHAGFSGSTEVTVTAFHLMPSQLRIGGLLFQGPEREKGSEGNMEIARVFQDEVIIEKYQSPR